MSVTSNEIVIFDTGHALTPTVAAPIYFVACYDYAELRHDEAGCPIEFRGTRGIKFNKSHLSFVQAWLDRHPTAQPESTEELQTMLSEILEDEAKAANCSQ